MVKNGTFGFAGDRARQQRLAGARRADQQHAARNLAAEALELLRIAQELDDLLEVLLGLVDAGDVLERHLALCLGQQLGLRLAEAHGAAAPPPCIWRMKKNHTPMMTMNGSQVIRQDDEGVGPVVLGPRADFDALVFEPLDEIGVARRIGLEGGAVVRSRCR